LTPIDDTFAFLIMFSPIRLGRWRNFSSQSILHYRSPRFRSIPRLSR